jgi:hypothetical protein
MTDTALSVSVESTVAGFIVWLARQRGPLDRRHRCSDTVDRFLRWRHDQRTLGASYTVSDYCTQLQRRGANEAQLEQTLAAIALSRRYLLAAD